MKSKMIYVSKEIELFLEEGCTIVGVQPLVDEPVYMFRGVWAWLLKYMKETFHPTEEEWKDMVNYTTRKIEFEVEVEYTEQPDGFVKPTNATLQTQGCPNYVKAWIECEAMHQFTKEQEKVKV